MIYKEFWQKELGSFKLSNGHAIGNCPICHESGGHFYANIHTGAWDCKKCQSSGNAWSFLKDYQGMENKQIVQQLNKYGISQDRQIENQAVSKPKVFDDKAIEYYCSRLTEEKLTEFSKERGLSVEIFKKYRLGINEADEITLPVVDEHGQIRNILRKQAGGSTISSKDGDGILFGVENLLVDIKEIFIVEGAWSAMALEERGFKAVGTCGAGVVKDEQIPLFKDKEVFLVPDNDEAGKAGVEKIAQKLKTVAKNIYVINLPVPEKHDVRDFFKDGGTAEQFENLIKQVKLTRLSDFPISLPEFLKKDIPPVEYFVMDIIQKKGKGMISATPNVGKSILVQNIALDIASGVSIFMKKFAVSLARVLYLDLEMGEPALHERFQKMCSSRSGSFENLYVKYIPALDLLNDESKKLIEEWLEELKVELLILDPLGNAWSGNESEQEKVGQLTAYLNTLIQKFGISILVVHHWRKATKEFSSGGQMAAGSYKWSAWLDNHATLEGSPASIAISCHKNRNRPRFEPFLAKLNPDTLSFEFVADCQKKFDEGTLIQLFNHFEREKVSIPELIQYSKEQKSCSESTLRKLIKNSIVFKIDSNEKTHYLVKNNEEVAIQDE